MRAIDFHVHLATHEWMEESLGPLREAQASLGAR